MSKSTASVIAASVAGAVIASAALTEVTTVAAPAVPKAPSKKSLATAIFAAKLVERSQGLFASNKEFRASVLTAIQIDLGVSTASAATMYNAAKAEAEKADTAVVLGRDPKKVKAPSATGKRGRPAGSKNAAKTDTDAVVAVAPAADAVVDSTVVIAAEPVVAAPAEAVAA